MKILQPLCVAMLALSASAGNAAATGAGMPGNPHTARDQVVSDESLGFTNTSNNLGWETPDLPYARLLTQTPTLNAAPRWRSKNQRSARRRRATADRRRWRRCSSSRAC